jgi:hypothetical protein
VRLKALEKNCRNVHLHVTKWQMMDASSTILFRGRLPVLVIKSYLFPTERVLSGGHELEKGISIHTIKSVI